MGGDAFLAPSSAIITPNIIRHLLLVADDHGVSLERALRSASLTRASVDSPALRVSYRQGRIIIEKALELIPVTALGLEVGRRQPITASGLLGLAMMSSATLLDAVRVGVRFQNLAGSMVRWQSAVEAASVFVTATVPDADSPVGRFLVEEGFANITRMARDVARITAPRLIQLAFAPERDRRVYAEYFGCAVEFSADRNAWHVPLQTAHEPLPTAEPWTLRETVALLEARMGTIAERQELVAVLAAHIEDALPEVRPFAEYALRLAMSERTLRRRLIEVGSSYSRVLDDVRKRLAAELFAAPGYNTAEIAYRLGYDDERSLRRSTLRWFGLSPKALHAAPHGAETAR